MILGSTRVYSTVEMLVGPMRDSKGSIDPANSKTQHKRARWIDR